MYIQNTQNEIHIFNFEQLCIHEASHAIMCMVQGVKLDTVQVCPITGEGNVSAYKITKHIALAGYVGEAMFFEPEYKFDIAHFLDSVDFKLYKGCIPQNQAPLEVLSSDIAETCLLLMNYEKEIRRLARRLAHRNKLHSDFITKFIVIK